MTVRVSGGTVHLVGRCPAEDAEALLVALQDDQSAIVDVSEAQHLHLAVVQVLLASGREVQGVPMDSVLARHLRERAP